MTLREYLENEENADIQRVTLYDDTDVTDRCTDNEYMDMEIFNIINSTIYGVDVILDNREV